MTDAQEEDGNPFIFVDGSNVAYGGGSLERPTMGKLHAVLNELETRGFRVVTIVDARLRHLIRERQELEELVGEGSIMQAPAGREADDFLLQLALKRQSRGDTVYILTNDMFPVKKSQGVIPRIAFMFIPLNGDDEIIFSPSLDSLIEPAEAESFEPSESRVVVSSEIVSPVDDVPRIDGELFQAFVNFLITLEPPPQDGSLIPFTNVAGYLHNQFDGDFCKRFGYRKPKDFALALEKVGYVKLRQEGLPLYLEVKGKLMDIYAEGGMELEEPAPVMHHASHAVESEGDILKEALGLLREENHYPTEDRIAAKLRILNPEAKSTIKEVLNKAMKSRTLTRKKKGDIPVYWPHGETWEATDPSDPEDIYSEDLWRAFEESLHRLPTHLRSAQTRYHLGRNLRTFGVPEIESLPQAKSEHMVQLAVNKGLLSLVETRMGFRINVPTQE